MIRGGVEPLTRPNENTLKLIREDGFTVIVTVAGRFGNVTADVVGRLLNGAHPGFAALSRFANDLDGFSRRAARAKLGAFLARFTPRLFLHAAHPGARKLPGGGDALVERRNFVTVVPRLERKRRLQPVDTPFPGGVKVHIEAALIAGHAGHGLLEQHRTFRRHHGGNFGGDGRVHLGAFSGRAPVPVRRRC